MKRRHLIVSMLLAPFVNVTAGEMGTGNGNEGPSATPGHPAESEPSGDSLWLELAEWFEVDSDSE